MSSPARYPWWATLVVVATVAASLVAIFWEHGPEATPGTVVHGEAVNMPNRSGGYESTEREDWNVALPLGVLRITSSVGRAVRVGDDEHVADGATRWVEVEWEHGWSRSGAVIWPGADLTERQEPPSRLVLVAGGRRYILREEVLSTSTPSSLVIAVANAEDVRFVVESGGRQRNATLERADSGDTGGVSAATCAGSVSATGGVRPTITCRLEGWRAPYVAGLGQAPKGKDWVVVHEASAFPKYGGDEVGQWSASRTREQSVPYVASGKPSLQVAVSGAERPVKTSGKAVVGTGESSLEMRAYLVPAEEAVEVRLTYRIAGVLADSAAADAAEGSPERVEVTAKASVYLDPQP